MTLKLGMVGGGQGSFIGGVHRMAARLDGRWELVAGALSSDPARAAASAADLGIAPDRSYSDFAQMALAEAARPEGKRSASTQALASAEDGLAGMRFIRACVRSNEAGGMWTVA